MMRAFHVRLSAEYVKDTDNVFVREAVCETGGGSAFPATNCSVIAVALPLLLKAFQTSGAKLC